MVESVSVSGYKTFKNPCLKLDGVNLLIGSNGAGKSNFLSLFELLNHAFEQRLAGYVGSIGGVDKLLFQGRKATEQISIRLDLAQNREHLQQWLNDYSLGDLWRQNIVKGGQPW